MDTYNLSLLGNRIKELRKQKGWTQEMLSKKAGYADKSMISRIENGMVNLSQSQIMKFAEVFNVEAGSLLGSHTYYTDSETAKLAQDIYDNPRLRALMDAARDCDPEDLKLAADMLLKFKRTNPNG